MTLIVPPWRDHAWSSSSPSTRCSGHGTRPPPSATTRHGDRRRHSLVGIRQTRRAPRPVFGFDAQLRSAAARVRARVKKCADPAAAQDRAHHAASDRTRRAIGQRNTAWPSGEGGRRRRKRGTAWYRDKRRRARERDARNRSDCWVSRLHRVASEPAEVIEDVRQRPLSHQVRELVRVTAIGYRTEPESKTSHSNPAVASAASQPSERRHSALGRRRTLHQTRGSPTRRDPRPSLS
jgi:hypothetical protein